jgi:ABC-type glycerol-3-phosphate transport system permease component
MTKPNTVPTSPPRRTALHRLILDTFSGRRQLHSNLILWAILLVIGFFWMYPILWILSAAFKTSREVFTAGPTLIPETWAGFSNFVRAWDVANFSRYFGNSVLYGVGSVLIAVFRSILAGYVLARFSFPGRRLILALVAFTVFIPVEASVIPQFRLVNWIDQNLFQIMDTYFIVPFMQGGAGSLWVLLFTGAFRALPQELFDAADVDGAGFWQKFLLSVPLVGPITATTVIFQFIHSWEDILTPIIYTLGRPELRNLQSGIIAFQGAQATDWVGLAAAIVITILPVIVVFLVFQRFFVQGLAGALKG